MKRDEVNGIINDKYKKLGGLISVLEEVQSKYGYLPSEAIKIISEKTGASLADIYGIATFYRAFSLKPRGKHLCSVCLGTACHVRGSPRVLDEAKKQLKVEPGETTDDRLFTLETVNCLGACALGPVVVVDGRYYANVSTSEVKNILDKTRNGGDKISLAADKRMFPVEVSCSHCNHSLMDGSFLIDDRPSIRVTAAFNQKHGWLRLSSLYGSPNVASEYEIAKGTEVNFFCPHCHSELRGASECPACGSPMVPMIVKGGGVVQICSRNGCKEHRLDIR
ncbi:MAG: hypothetical protein Kow0090_21300 [Myxococcota bacterium]